MADAIYARRFNTPNIATRSLIDGTSFGDNLIATLPDVLGSTIGASLAGAINGPKDYLKYPHGGGGRLSRPTDHKGLPINHSLSGPPGVDGYLMDLRTANSRYNWRDWTPDVLERGYDYVTGKVSSLASDLWGMAQNASDDIGDIIVIGSKYVSGAAASAQQSYNDFSRSVREGAIVTSLSKVAKSYGTARRAATSGSRLLADAIHKIAYKPLSPVYTAVQPPMSFFDYPLQDAPTYKWTVTPAGAAAAGLEVAGLKGGGRAANAAGEIITLRRAGATAEALAAERAAASGARTVPAVFDGELATRKLLGTTTTPGGRQIMFHAADRMVNPPAGRIAMTPTEIDAALDGGIAVKRSYHPQGGTLTIENPNLPGRPRVIVDEATGQRVITVINPRRR